jgi:hypothetical protein
MFFLNAIKAPAKLESMFDITIYIFREQANLDFW